MLTLPAQRSIQRSLYPIDAATKTSEAQSEDGSSTSLTVSRHRGDDGYHSSHQVSEREQAMEQRRRDREAQHHTQVWTKASHGGPYRKVVLSNSTPTPKTGAS